MTSDPKFTRAGAVTTFHADDSGSDNSNDNGDWSTGGSDALNEDERLMMRHSIRCSFLNKTTSSSHKPTQPPTPPLRCHVLLYEVVMMMLLLVLLINVRLSLKATRLLLLQFLPSQRSSSQLKKHGHVKPTSTDFN